MCVKEEDIIRTLYNYNVVSQELGIKIILPKLKIKGQQDTILERCSVLFRRGSTVSQLGCL